MIESHRGRPLPADVDSYPLDVSPYGVCGMAGNMRDWCADLYRPEGPPLDGGRLIRPGAPPGWPDADAEETRRAHRGGYWLGRGHLSGLYLRNAHQSIIRSPFVGFRAARTFPSLTAPEPRGARPSSPGGQ